jgi:hypothetical protein
MHYDSIIDITPESKTYGEPQGLVRGEGFHYEYYDRRAKGWIEDPTYYGDVTGLYGGGPHYSSIPVAEANELIDEWNMEDSSK